jgi:hypothetical protein
VGGGAAADVAANREKMSAPLNWWPVAAYSFMGCCCDAIYRIMPIEMLMMMMMT